MLVETDSPYLAPVPFRGRQNQPAWVVYVGRALAAIKKIDEKDCASPACADTFSRVFGAPGGIGAGCAIEDKERQAINYILTGGIVSVT